ncbi:hypothetical protein F53441_3256 [Fusarium austroafricanum]|uniref:Uncharacterized protein n=1 Tax=Fusarium austroafricanum TaxID=2364996 RepID=A0A8H4KQM2_9HYPO|nr:hypothetical protein F53441_3256 [Fusarium austroafricanum]
MIPPSPHQRSSLFHLTRVLDYFTTHSLSTHENAANMAPSHEATVPSPPASPAPSATLRAEPQEIESPSEWPKNIEATSRNIRYVERIEEAGCLMLSSLAIITEHVNKNPQITMDEVKEYLNRAAGLRAGGDDRAALHLSDINAARKAFVEGKGKLKRKVSQGVSKAPTELPDENEQEGADSGADNSNISNATNPQQDSSAIIEVQDTDDEDELVASAAQSSARPPKFLVAIKSRKLRELSKAECNSKITGDIDDEDLPEAGIEAVIEAVSKTGTEAIEAGTLVGTQAGTQAVIGTGDTPVGNRNTPVEPSPVKPQKRERSITCVTTDQSNKRVRNNDTSSDQAAPLPAGPRASLNQYDNNAQLFGAAKNYHSHLAAHARGLGAQHAEKVRVLNHFAQSIDQQLGPHQQHLANHRSVQGQVLGMETQLAILQEENNRLVVGGKSLDDAKEVWMQISPDRFEGLVQDHRELMADNVNSLRQVQAQLHSARNTLGSLEAVARPALLLMHEAKPQHEAMKAATVRLGKRKAHVEFLGLLVKAGPSAIETLEAMLQSKDLSLEGLANMITQNGEAADENGQPSAAPTT